MRPALVAVLVSVAAIRPASAADPAAENPRGLSIAILVQKDETGAGVIDRGGTFSVLFTNRSEVPVRLWSEHSERGYGTLSFDVDAGDAPSRMYLIPRRPEEWQDRPRPPLTIPAGKMFSWVVAPSAIWGERAWAGVPEPNTGRPVSLTAVFEIESGEAATEQGVWTGRITSEPVAALFVDTKLKTPADYLQEGYTKRAIRMLEADPKLISEAADNFETPLHIAVQSANIEVIQWLLSHGANVNARAYNQFTPLHFAKDPKVARLLVSHKADVNAISAGGTALREAASSYAHLQTVPRFRAECEQALAVARVLIDAGADYDLASACYLDDIERVRRLLADKRLARDKRAMSAAARHGRTEIVRLLLQRGADPEDAGSFGLTVSYFAVEHADILQMLFDAGADPRVVVTYHGSGQGPQGSTLLHEAAEKGAVKSVELLLARGLHVDRTVQTSGTISGRTPLHAACREGHVETVRCLLEHKANPLARLLDGSTPMSIAASQVRPEQEDDNARFQAVIRLLEQAKVEVDIFAAIACDDLPRVNAILRAEPQSRQALNPEGRPALHRAVTLDRREIARLLLRRGCDPDIRSADTSSGHESETALHAAAYWGHLEIARMLIEHGADVNARAKGGVTPLHEAGRLQHPEVVQLLVEHGAEINAEDDAGGTPLDWSQQHGQLTETAELLVSLGARNGNAK